MADTTRITQVASPNQSLLEEHCEEIFDQLAREARKKIRGWPMGGGDEGDVALSVMRTFIRRDKELKFAELQGSKDLLHLLLWLTTRKIADKRRQQLRPKHGGGRVLGSRELERNDGRLRKKPAGEYSRKKSAEVSEPKSEPITDSDLADEFDSACLQLLDLLDEEHRQVAILRVQGHSNEEIKRKLGWSIASVERRLRSIRERWRDEDMST